MQAKAHGRWELMVAPHLAQSFSAISDATSGAMSPRWPLVRSPIWGGGGGLGGGRPRGRQGLTAVARCWLWWQRWWDGGSTHPSRPGFGAGGMLRGRAPGLGHGWWHCRSGWSRALGWKESRGSWCWLWVSGGLMDKLTLAQLPYWSLEMKGQSTCSFLGVFSHPLPSQGGIRFELGMLPPQRTSHVHPTVPPWLGWGWN